MSATKNNLARHSNLKNLTPLVDAIKAIPTGPRFDAGKALLMFTQTTLCALIDTHSRLGNPLRFATRIDHHAFGFTPFVRENGQAFGWEMKVTEAYYRAVQSNEPFEDVLTAIHGEFLSRFGGNGLGQHFTPADLAKLAGLLGAQHFKKHPQDGLIRIGEPTCGAGSLIMGSISELMKSEGRGVVSRLSVTANDLDPLCSAMTTLQLVANQFIHALPLAQIEVTVGNTLTMDLRMAFQSMSCSYLESQDGRSEMLTQCFQPTKKSVPNVFGNVAKSALFRAASS